MKNQNEIKNHEPLPEKGSNNIKPQNQHYNIRKQSLGPNSKRGK